MSDKYDLEDADARLRRLRDDDDLSLRALEDRFNEWIVRSVLDDAGWPAITAELDSIRHHLDDAGPDEELRDRLDEIDVDADDLADDFVSYQTMRKHFNTCLDVDTAREPDVSAEDSLEFVQKVIGRSKRVSERTIESLDRHSDDHVAGDVTVDVSATVSCSECGAVMPFEVFIESGGCHCED